MAYKMKSSYPEYNSPENLTRWAKEALEDSTALKESDKTYLMDVAKTAIGNGCWRGDISDMWQDLGWTIEDIPDLYV
jgi:hypothetical protein